MLESMASSTTENAIFVMEMVKAEAEKGQIRLIIVTSAYHLPFTTWCFRQVAAAMKVHLGKGSKKKVCKIYSCF